MKIGIVGAGISGLGAAYLLSQEHDVTVFEKNNYIGGHSRTIDVKNEHDSLPVDTGFIVFNDWNYPNLFGLFDALNVPYEKSDMSFGVSIRNGWLEYSSSALFVQKTNFLRPSYYGMIFNILRFNKEAPKYIEKDSSISLKECLDQLNMGEWFKQYYLLAMGAAIWSCSVETIMEFPAKTFLRFFKNHGLLSVNNRPQWYTVKGGSREYVSRLLEGLKDVRIQSDIDCVIPQNDSSIVIRHSNGEEEKYDQVVLACHADEALTLISEPSKDEKDILGSFRYQDNWIVVHNDENFMPKRKKCWASWVYLSENKTDEKQVVSLSYWMNNLQNFASKQPVLVTLNPGRMPDENFILDQHKFSHPIFDKVAIDAQEKIQSIQGARGLWFCGAYQRYGFHEDGLWSAVNVAKSMGVNIPWD